MAASAGVGSIHLGAESNGGVAADVAAGVALSPAIRLGARFVATSSFDITFFSDQPSWSARTLLAVAQYTVLDSALTLSTGMGRMTARQEDSPIRGTGSVLETGVEVASPSRHGPSLRLVVFKAWALGRTTWRNSSLSYGKVSLFHVGIGFLLH